MRLSWIEVRDFRNHANTGIEVPVGLTALIGANAQGKTNLLEAVYYLLALESPRVRNDLPLVRVGSHSAFLRGEVMGSTGRFLLEVEIRASGQNRVYVNRSPVRRKRDLRGSVRAVFSGPDDLAIVQGDPEERRRFMDEATRTLWPMREGVAAAYDRVLRQRNRLLKEWDGRGEPLGLAGWDAELVARGAALTAARAEAVARLAGRATEEFQAMTGDPLRVRYQPSVGGDPLAERFALALASRRGDELVRRTTLVGPHRDELEIAIGGLILRGFASHGEAWAAALCLRLALADATADELGDAPVSLLDDPFSGLDPDRQRRLGERLNRGEQTLISVPDESQVPVGATRWTVRRGEVASG